jgi:hypothetical protein
MVIPLVMRWPSLSSLFVIDNFSFRSWIYAQIETPRPATISGYRDCFWFALPPLACSPKREG